ncbi:MAG: ABC transporter ATP-binding protein [Chloroflexi bacterium]|nr:MAG: ABC transporter ATP-binding protein [Chloroflexota bacterium]
MIDVRDLHRSFGGVTALDGVTLAVAEGERRAIIGPNGAGKTTLFNVLTGELAPTGGTVRLAGEDVTGRRTFELARRGLARMYQRNELFDPLTARENVALALTAKAGPYRFGGIPADEARAADELLERVGLAGAGATPARALSHGQRRQLELAVALATAPRVLLLDEPTAGMSPAETARIAELIAALDRALTLLIVEHDMDVVFRLADRITVLHEGKVIADGTPAQVRGDTLVNEVYLGKVIGVEGAPPPRTPR